MSDVQKWQGYLIKSQGDNHLICSPWILDGSSVFGHDSDYTTLAISLLRYLSIDFKTSTLTNIDEKISQETLLASTDFVTGNEGFTITCNDDASVSIFLDNHNSIELPTDDLLKVIISKTLSDKQININPKISDFIINNVERSYEKMFKILKDIDELSLSTGKSININLIKKVLSQ